MPGESIREINMFAICYTNAALLNWLHNWSVFKRTTKLQDVRIAYVKFHLVMELQNFHKCGSANV